MTVGVGDIVRITAKLQLAGIGDIVNVFHFSVAANTTPNDTQFMLDTAGAIDALYAPLTPFITTQVTYQSIEGQNISKDELLPSTAWPTQVAGTGAAEMLPEMNSVCVFHRTLKPRVRASKFLPPMTEDSNVAGVVNVLTVAVAQAFGDALVAGLTNLGVSLVYVAFNRLLSTSTVVTQALVPVRFRTQRRRRLGVGS